MKYVVVMNEMEDLVPIIFPETIQHRTIPSHSNQHKVISAGFCVREQGKWRAYGESISLRVKSRPEDSVLLTEFFGPKDLETTVKNLRAHVSGLLHIIELMELDALPKDYATSNNLRHWVEKARKAIE